MKSKLLLALLSSLWATTAFATDYVIDPAHTTVGFSIRHMMVSNVKGAFSNVSGTVSYDPANVAASTVEVVVGIDSIDTRQAKRDTHLKSDDFFDAGKFPMMKFKSTKVVANGPGKLLVTGLLTIRDVSKEVDLEVNDLTPEVKDMSGEARVGASAVTKLKRQDFGLTWNKLLEAGGVAVGDDVTVNIDVELKKKA